MILKILRYWGYEHNMIEFETHSLSLSQSQYYISFAGLSIPNL